MLILEVLKFLKIILENSSDPLRAIEILLVRGVIQNNNFHRVLIDTIKNMSLKTNNCTFVINRATKELYDIDKYSDRNVNEVSRERGGLINGFTRTNEYYEKFDHLILPIKSTESKLARFYYKTQMGHRIWKNFGSKKRELTI